MAEKRTRKPPARPVAASARPMAEAMLAPAKSAEPAPTEQVEQPAPEPTEIAVAPVAPDAPAEAPFAAAEPAPAPEPMAAEAATPMPPVAPSEPIEAANTPTPGKAIVMAAPFLKGFLKMATAPESTYAAAAAPFQSMFGDVNERAKSAVEKTTKFAEDMNEFTKGNVEAIVASGRVAAKGAEAMTQEAAEYSKKSFESATGAMKSFAAVKSPTELFQLQSEFAKSSFETAIAEASKLSESMLKLMGEIAQPLSSRYAVAAEKFKTSSF